MLQAGIKGKKEITVTLDKTAKAMGSVIRQEAL